MLLLLQLKHGSKYGYEMLKNIREEFEGVWEPQTGTIYPSLKSLVSRDLVRTEDRDETEFYLLTEKGEELLSQIGKRIQKNIRFTFRYIAFLNKWMPQEMLPTVVGIIETLAKEDQVIFPNILEKLDSEDRREVYENLIRISERRIHAIQKSRGEEDGLD
jgi:DNA-binding PadR family transcriptional regulator